MTRPAIPARGLVPYYDELKAVLDDLRDTADAHELALADALTDSVIDTDSTMAADSDVLVPSQKAVKTALAGKAASSHTHAQSDITNLATDLAGKLATTVVIDEDNMASNSAAHVPTQQSVKAYVDGARLMPPSSGTYYLSPINQGPGRASASNIAITAGRLTIVPMPVYRPVTLTRIWAAVQTQSAAGGLARLAICRAANPGDFPTVVLAEGEVSIETTGTKEVTGLNAAVGIETVYLAILPSLNVTMQGASAAFGATFHNIWTVPVPSYYRDGVSYGAITGAMLVGAWTNAIGTYPALAVRN